MTATWSGSVSLTNSLSLATASFTPSFSVSPSYTLSTSVTVAFNYPQIFGIINAAANTDLFNLRINWARPQGFNYQFYELFLIVNGTALVIPNIIGESIVLNAANTNGLVQPGTDYVVQVRGFLNGAYGPQSLPITVSTAGGDVYGPTGTDGSSVNTLKCNYFPKQFRCTWSTGARPWINATFYVWCRRAVTPYVDARAYIVQKVLNTAGSTVLPTTSIVPLPSGCQCTATLTAFYSTPTIRVDLTLPPLSGGFINTDKSNLGFPNTPVTLILP